MKLLVRKNIFKGHVASLCYDEVWHNYDNSVKKRFSQRKDRGVMYLFC